MQGLVRPAMKAPVGLHIAAQTVQVGPGLGHRVFVHAGGRAIAGQVGKLADEQLGEGEVGHGLDHMGKMVGQVCYHGIFDGQEDSAREQLARKIIGNGAVQF
jgi:hypothetical protein